MITKISQQNERVAFLEEIDQENAKKELILALTPLRHVAWINEFIKKLKSPQASLPHQENAPTEKFMLGINIALCLFMQDQKNTIRHGLILKKYIDKYALEVSPNDSPVIINQLYQLINRTSQGKQKNIRQKNMLAISNTINH